MMDEHCRERTDSPYHAIPHTGQAAAYDCERPMSFVLPFTHGIDALALTTAFALVQHWRVHLVALSLIRLPTKPNRQGPRLGAIEQSKDFLVYVQQVAERHGISITCVERYTSDPVQTIRTFAQDSNTAGVLLFVRNETGVLLSTDEVKPLLADGNLSRYLVSLQPQKRSTISLLSWLASWFTSA